MAVTSAKTVIGGPVESRTALQLLFCHCFIFTVALIAGAQVLPLLGACLLSFLFTLNIPYNLHMLEMMLDRLAHDLPVEPVPLRLRWPLTRLFALTNALGQQSRQQVQMEQSNLAYRDRLLQQVSKTAAQEERNRLARDLHDSIKQQIFSIAVSAAAVKARWEHDLISARKIVDDIERVALETQIEMQALLQQLRPTALENVGLIESLRMQCQALGYRTGAEVTTELGDLPTDELLPLGAQETIFRIVQEGFANIARHARASHVWLSLRRQRDALLVEIGDDGQGFDLAQASGRGDSYGGMGLSNVQERVRDLGGTVAVWSLPGKGTTLHLCIPLVKPPSHAREQQPASQALAAAMRWPRRILQGGMLAAELAAALVLLYTPASIALWAVGLCILLALTSLLWVQRYRLQIALEFGHEHVQNLLLRAENYGLLAGILLLCMLWPGYFVSLYWAAQGTGFPALPGQAQGLHPALQTLPVPTVALVFSGIFVIAIVLTYARYSQNINRYYKSLSNTALREQVRRQLRQVLIDWAAWIFGLALTILLLNIFPAGQAQGPYPSASLSPVPVETEVMHGMGLIVLIAWLIALLAKSVRVARWHNVLRRAGTRPLVPTEGGGA